jgi:hypothetical protein
VTSQDIVCAAGGLLIAVAGRLTVVDKADQTTAGAPLDAAWHVETAAPGWFVFRHEPSGQVPAVSRRNDTEVTLVTIAEGTRHHWRIIRYPERGNAVIISRVTGLALTAGTSDGGRPPPVGLTDYCGAVTQHWSFTTHLGRRDVIPSKS